MTDDSPKVVNLRGQPVDHVGETPPAVFAVLETIMSAARGDTYPTIGVVLMDKTGASLLRWETGGNPVALVGALEALKFEILKQRGK